MRPHALRMSSKLLFELFAIAFAVSLLATWYTMIVKKDFAVFMEEENVPEATDFFAGLSAPLKELWTQ